MSRRIAFCTGLVLAVAALGVRADVKMTDHVTTHFEGALGILNHFSGAAAKNGVTSTVAVKGPRLLRLNESTGEIIDLSEQKVYALEPKHKQYTVKTFDEIRADVAKEEADTAKAAPGSQTKAPAEGPSGPEYVTEVTVQDTGQHKTIAGYDAHEVTIVATSHIKGQTLEQGGGSVWTTDTWIGPKIAALDELRTFMAKYTEAIYGAPMTAEIQQIAAQMMALSPAFKTIAADMETKTGTLNGAPLSSTMTYETVKSADEMKTAQSDQSSQQNSGGGGIGGFLGKKIGPKQGAPQQRSKILTVSQDVLTIGTTVTDADVAIPAGFREKK